MEPHTNRLSVRKNDVRFDVARKGKTTRGSRCREKEQTKRVSRYHEIEKNDTRLDVTQEGKTTRVSRYREKEQTKLRRKQNENRKKTETETKPKQKSSKTKTKPPRKKKKRPDNRILEKQKLNSNTKQKLKRPYNQIFEKTKTKLEHQNQKKFIRPFRSDNPRSDVRPFPCENKTETETKLRQKTKRKQKPSKGPGLEPYSELFYFFTEFF